VQALRSNIRSATADRDYLSVFDTAQMSMLGRPVVMTNQAPVPTVTTSAPIALYGNLNRHLKIRRKRGMTVKVNDSGTSLSGRNLNYQLGRELVFSQRIGHQLVLVDGMVHLVTR
jgi:HK97 family phage major capsid protein